LASQIKTEWSVDDVFRVDALVVGQRLAIPPETMQDQCPPESQDHQAYTFHSRPRHLVDSERSTQLARFEELSSLVTFGFISAEQDDQTRRNAEVGRTAFHRPYYSRSGNNLVYARSDVYLMVELVMPLLRADLTESERLVQHFEVAKTVSMLPWIG
jgi:hypothetical protein